MPRLKLAVALGVAVTSLLPASPAAADEPVELIDRDPSIFPPPSTRWPLLGVGAATTAVWYGGALGFSYLWPDAPGANDLRIPVAGPWMALADTGCADTDPDCSTFIVVLRAILTTMDAVGQTGGVLVMGEALFLPTAEPAPVGPRREPRAERKPGPTMFPAPMSTGKNGWGFGIVGRF